MAQISSRWIAMVSLVAVAAIAGWLAWRCRFDDKIRFLPRHGPAEWILYPNAPDIAAHDVAKRGGELSAVFRRSVVLEKVPARIPIQIRALENFGLQINGQVVPVPAGSSNWKASKEVDAQRWFTPGTNQILITITNRAGPPLLWFSLQAGEQRWFSDASWEVSYADAVWRPAHLATTPRTFGKGNPMRSSEGLAHAARSKLWIHAGLLLTSILVVWAATRLANRAGWLRPNEAKYAALGGLILVWIVMLIHNFSQLPPVIGFDATHHLDYIRAIQTWHGLPKTDEGWETHQPPLYYVVCASLMQAGGLSAASPEGLMALRVVSLLVGVGQILFVFASLRLLFPNELRRPLLGAGMAATLPAHLYHAHYITNETMFALFVSAVFYFALRILRRAEFSPLSCAGLGACIGLALLTKLSALILVPVVFAVLFTGLLLRRESSLKVWAGTLALPLFIGLLICGRYYWNMWAEGGPFANASRWAYGSGWWQEDGFRTGSFYFRFGKALVQPLYGSFHSFWDGMYSTLWGDGLCGGSTSFDSRPPWNYQLLALGYWLALAPTLSLITGFVIAAGTFLRRPSPQWMLLVGTMVTFVFAAIYFSLIAPGASQVRASFGLMLLVPFCAFFAFGVNRLLSLRRGMGLVLGTLVLWSALNSLVAHWIPTGSAQAQMLRANFFIRNGHAAEAARAAEDGFKHDPSNALLRGILADARTQTGKTNEARQLIAESLVQWPNDPMSHLDAAFDLVRAGKLDEAVVQTRRALAVAPDHPAATKQLAALLAQQKHFAEAEAACHEALRVTPHDAQLREWLKQLRDGKSPFPDQRL
ncbi:MAG: tetratricopeptide repeat protein [Akkermansiaceae bacterium]|nr:tetratricopeptide repeat protein [Verrucomicrobiales bacterium]